MILFKCNSQKEFFLIQVIIHQKLILTNGMGFLLYLKFLPWLIQLSLSIRHTKWWFFLFLSLHKCIHSNIDLFELRIDLILFEYYSHKEFFHLQVIFHQKLIPTNLVEFLLYLEFWFWRIELNLRLQHPKKWIFLFFLDLNLSIL